jgi:hypothetical protein
MSLPDEVTINSAVQRCVTAWRQALAFKKVTDPFEPGVWSHDYAGQAYRNAMPWLSTPDNVDAFIACVAHGLAIGAIDRRDATKLLYAAQVAITSRRARLQAEREARAEKTQPDKKPATPTTNAGAPGPSPLVTREGSQPAQTTPTPLPLGRKGAEGAMAAPQVPKAGAPVPSPLGTWEGSQPSQTTPLPPAVAAKGPEGAMAVPQVPKPVASAPPTPLPPSQKVGEPSVSRTAGA